MSVGSCSISFNTQPMSLIEGDAYFPLFSTAEIPIDFSAVPDSPGKLQQYARRPSFALSTSQAVPANINIQNLGLDEPLFSLFMNGPDKMDLNYSGFVKGLQIPEELLLQSSMVPELRKGEGANMMGMDQRQLYHIRPHIHRTPSSFLVINYIHDRLIINSVQMGILPTDPMVNGDFNMVPQLSPNGGMK
jgi:hypothetical protein